MHLMGSPAKTQTPSLPQVHSVAVAALSAHVADGLTFTHLSSVVFLVQE